DHVCLGEGGTQGLDYLTRPRQVLGDQAEDTVFVAVHDRHGDQIDLLMGQDRKHVGHPPWFGFEKDRDLLGSFHEPSLLERTWIRAPCQIYASASHWRYGAPLILNHGAPPSSETRARFPNLSFGTC